MQSKFNLSSINMGIDFYFNIIVGVNLDNICNHSSKDEEFDEHDRYGKKTGRKIYKTIHTFKIGSMNFESLDELESFFQKNKVLDMHSDYEGDSFVIGKSVLSGGQDSYKLESVDFETLAEIKQQVIDELIKIAGKYSKVRLINQPQWG